MIKSNNILLYRCEEVPDDELCFPCEAEWLDFVPELYLQQTWAEGFVVMATAWYLGIDIWVTSSNNTRDHPWSRFSSRLGRSPSNAEHNAIRVISIRRSHFQSLYHTDEIPRPFVKPQRPAPRSRPKTDSQKKVYFHLLCCTFYTCLVLSLSVPIFFTCYEITNNKKKSF